MSKRVRAVVLGAIALVIGLFAAIVPARWYAAKRRGDIALARADRAIADAPPPTYDRPPLDQPDCTPMAIEPRLYTELRNTCTDLDWEARQALRTNPRNAAGTAECLLARGRDLERISTLGCGPFEPVGEWGDPEDALGLSSSPEETVVEWLVTYATLQPPARCLDLVLRALRISQDQAARADSMALRLNSVAAPFTHREQILGCMERAEDETARRAAQALEQMVDHHPPIDRAAVIGTASYVRAYTEMYRESVEEESPYWLETPWQVQAIDGLQAQWGDILDGDVPDWRRYPETLPDVDCESGHDLGPCRLSGDAFWLREARLTALAAWALAESSPLHFRVSLEALERDIGVDPTDASRLQWRPSSDLRLARVHVASDHSRNYDVVLIGPRYPEDVVRP